MPINHHLYIHIQNSYKYSLGLNRREKGPDSQWHCLDAAFLHILYPYYNDSSIIGTLNLESRRRIKNNIRILV